jgi:fibronectin-binding autotransporter adhesin
MHRAHADVLATWNGSTGNWSNAVDWSSNTVPTTGYDVTINAGAIALDVNPAIQLLSWSGGTLSTGRLTVAGGITLAGTGTDTLSNATLTNASGQTALLGTTGNLDLALQNGAEFLNAGTFSAANGTITNGGGAASLFNNTGNFTLGLAASGNTFTLGIPFANTGAVKITTGILSLTAGDNGFTGGAFTINSGGTLAFNGGTYNFDSSFAPNGLGAIAFNSGTFNFAASALSTNSNVTITGGTLTGSTGSFANSANPIKWSGGTIAVATEANAGISFVGGGTDTLSDATLTNGLNAPSTIGATGNVTLALQDGAQFINAGTLTASNGTITSGRGAASLFTNSGNFNVNFPGIGLFTVGVPFSNSGIVNVQSGILSLTAGDGGSTSGTFNIGTAVTAALDFDGGTYSFAASASFPGTGTLRFNSGTFNFGANIFTIKDAVTFNNGTFNGTGSLTFNNFFVWGAGTVAVPIKANGGLDLPAGTDILSNASLTNASGQTGSMGVAGTILLSLQNNAQFANAGIFTASDGNITNAGATPSSVTNTGTFNVKLSTPANTFTISTALANSGTVNVQAGTLSLTGGDGGSTTGTFNVSSGATLLFTSGTFSLGSTANIAGTGTVILSNSTFNFNSNSVSLAGSISMTSGTLNGPGSLTFNSPFTWSGGMIAVTTTAHVGLTFAGAGTDVLSGAFLTNSPGSNATIGTGGNVNLALQFNAQLVNFGTFTATNGSISNGGGGSFTNGGAFNVNLPFPTSTFTVGVPMANNAIVNVQNGTLNLTGGDGGSTSGTFTISAGATLHFNASGPGSTFSFSSSASIIGPGTAWFDAGNFLFTSGTVTFASPLNLNGASLNTFGGSLTTTSTLTWSGGTIAVPTQANGGLILAGGGFDSLSSTLTNALGQTATIGTGGNPTLFLQSGGQFVNAGTFTASNGTILGGGGTSTLFLNAGIFNVNLPLSTNTFTIGGPFANSGTVHVQNGTLVLAGGESGLTTSIFNIDALATLTLNGNLTLTGAAKFTVGGTLQFAPNTGGSKIPALTLTGTTGNWSGRVDLTNNRLILETIPSTKATALATLQNQVNYGKTHPTGILSTTIPANQGLAVADNALLTTLFTTFGGLPVDSNSLLVGLELLGDSNFDGKVDLTDLNTVLNHLGTTTPAWTSGNFDGAATIDLTDLNDVLNHLGTSIPNPDDTSPFNIQNSSFSIPSAPEPASLSLLAFGPLLLTRRRTPGLS